MASSALEAKINKIRQQNEEIKRRYEEVEEDKKNAAKLNALVQMVPSTDWPERKEPPEFSNPPRTKQKVTKDKHEYVPQPHVGEGKKVHTFAQGEGPPPDPKYNFLADSEREETSVEYTRENVGNRTHSKMTRGNFRKKNIGRDGMQKDNKIHKGSHRDDYQPGYDAWRAERNRIDEDRISRQRTAEGNWRREWDNDKMHIVDDGMKTSTRPTLADFAKKDHKDFDRRYYANGNEHLNHGRGGNHRPHRGAIKTFHGGYENRSHNMYDQHRHNVPMPVKAPLSPTSEERTVTAMDKNIKVTLNQGNVTKGPVMSVKVNSPSIAGTGRVGPRQRTRVTYSHSDADAITPEIESFSRQKSFDDKSKGAYFNSQKSPNVKRSQSLKKKEIGAKSPYLQRKEAKREESDLTSHRHFEHEIKTYAQKDVQKPYSVSKSPRPIRGNTKAVQDESLNSTLSCVTDDTEITADKSDVNLKENNADVQCPEKNTTVCSDFGSTEVKENVRENNTPPQTPTLDSHEIQQSDIENKDPDSKDAPAVTNNEDENSEQTLIKEQAMETVPDPVASIENSELIAKDTNQMDENVANKTDSKDVNILPEVLQEKCDPSSSELISSSAQPQEKLALNESNKVSNDTTDLDTSCKDNEQSQSLKEFNEPSVCDNCDNIKDEAIDERSDRQETTENHVRSSEAETCSVIEITDPSVCTEEIIPKETVTSKEETQENHQSNVGSDIDLKDVTTDNVVDIENNTEPSVANATGDLKDKVESQNTVEEEAGIKKTEDLK